MILRKIFFGAMIALVFLFSLAPHALAQDPNRLAQLQISIWPEYDQPSILVLLDGTLADQSGLPRDVSILIPTGAELFVTTSANPDGSLAPEVSSKSTDLGDGFTRVTFTVSQPKFRVEYYHNLLRGAPDKTFDFVYKAMSGVDQVTLEIQQPLRATNFAVTPATQTSRTASDGFKYFILQFSNIAANQTISAQAKYTKADNNPSVQPQTSQPPAPVTTSAPVADSTSTIFVLVGVVIVGLAGVIGFFLWQQRARESETSAPRKSAKQFQRERRRARGTEKSASVFCTQCGNPLNADDNFCPKCGAKRRVV